MINLPDIEKSWEMTREVFEAIFEKPLRGFDKFRKQWLMNKAELIKLFGKDGRLYKKMDKISHDMYLGLLNETKTLFYNLGLDRPDIIDKIKEDEFRYNKIIFKNEPNKQKNIGMKLSKFLLKYYIPEEITDNFEKGFSRIIGKARTSGTVVLSINPLDILFMSVLGVESCHCIDDGEGDHGSHAAGTLSYMTDKYTAISFLINNNMKGVWINYKDLSFKYPWKLWRQICYIDIKSLSACLMKQYPDSNKDALNITKELIINVLSSYVNKPSIKTEECMDRRIYNINELAHIDPIEAVVKLNYELAKDPLIKFNHNPVCIVCGEDDITEPDLLTCLNCDESCLCHNCGSRIKLDVAITAYEGKKYCHYCYHSNFENCKGCGEIYPIGYLTVLSDGYVYCEHCIENKVYKMKI